MSPMTEAEYQAEDDLRTLMEAAEIQADSKRMKAANDCAKKKMAKMEKAGLVGKKRVMGNKKKSGDKSGYDMSK